MEAISSIVGFVQTPAFLGALLAISEALALIPSIKANSIFQLIANWIKELAKKDDHVG